MDTIKRGKLPLHWLMLIGFIVGLGGGLLGNLTRPWWSVWPRWAT
mgnify:CR=1 FL=1